MRGVTVAALCAIAGAASAGGASDPDDVQPTSHDVALPDPDLADPPAPAGLPTTPPAPEWWKQPGACPKGTHHVEKRQPVDYPKGTVVTHECAGKGPWPRPKSGGMREGPRPLWGDYWVDEHDKTDGAFRELMGTHDEHVGFMVHGVEEGRQIDRRTDGGGENVHTYRAGHRHGFEQIAMNSMPSVGYVGDGGPVGTWIYWRSSDGVVRARLRYAAGKLDGAQRWWTPDGAVLARGTFTAGDGTWKLDAPGGARSETRCHGDQLVELTAWDTHHRVTVHACGPAAPAGCGAAVGPTDGPARVALGADGAMCDAMVIPPLGIF
jgi:hypothetical protein